MEKKAEVKPDLRKTLRDFGEAVKFPAIGTWKKFTAVPTNNLVQNPVTWINRYLRIEILGSFSCMGSLDKYENGITFH